MNIESITLKDECTAEIRLVDNEVCYAAFVGKRPIAADVDDETWAVSIFAESEDVSANEKAQQMADAPDHAVVKLPLDMELGEIVHKALTEIGIDISYDAVRTMMVGTTPRLI